MSDGLRYLPICEPCIRGEGEECHTPGCALWMRDVPPDGLADLPVGDLVAERDALRTRVEALASEMCDADTERGTMPRVRMRVRRYWASRLRQALADTGQGEQP